MKWKAYSQRSWYRGDGSRSRPFSRLKWIFILLMIYLIGLMWRLAWLSASANSQESKANEAPSGSNNERSGSHENQPANLLVNQPQADFAKKNDKQRPKEDDERNRGDDFTRRIGTNQVDIDRIRTKEEKEKRSNALKLRNNNRARLEQNTRGQQQVPIEEELRSGDRMGNKNENIVDNNKNEVQSNDESSQLEEISDPALVEEELKGCDWKQYLMPPTFSNTSQRAERPWLLITIPTVARSRPYLALVLSSIASQLPKSNHIQVAVVHNLHPGQNYSHETYEIEREFRKKDSRFHFIDLVNTLPVVDGPEKGGRNVPGAKVRAQTRDLVNTLTLVHKQLNPNYMMFMEDDFLMCKEALSTFIYIIRRMNEQWNAFQGWNLVRFSFGFNGFILQRDDIQVLADYLLKHQVRRPPDHLLVEWFAGETTESAADKRGRVHAAYRFNLLDHMGLHSTLRDGLQPYYMRCWQPLTFPTIFEVEVFKNECSKMNHLEDLWPCTGGATESCPPWTFVSRSVSLM